MKMKKLNRFISILLITVIVSLFGSFSAFAAPESLSNDIVSNVESLFTLKTPDTENLSTTNKVLPVSCVAPEGAVITLYKYSAITDSYNKLYAGETPFETTVGATMLYATQLELTMGSNKFMVYCTMGDENYQVQKFEVKLLNESFMEKIKSIAGIIFN